MRRLFFSLMLVVLVLTPVSAQDDDPFLAALSLIPDNALTRTEIYYNDRAAITEAYPALIPPNLDAARNADLETRNPFMRGLNVQRAVWWAVFQNNATSQVAQFMSFAEETEQLLGFSLFDIQQEVYFGSPPANATLFTLDYDVETVREALADLDFAEEPDAAVELWCGPDGCDSGDEMDIRGREMGNPFGGQFGRKQPLVLGDGHLLSSPALEQVEQHLSTVEDERLSLLENPRYALLAETAASYGPVMQAIFFDGDALASLRDTSSAEPLLMILSPEERAARIEDLLGRLDTAPGDLPPYNLLLLADTATEDEQVALVLLGYNTVEDAEAAAEVLPARLASYFSLAQQQSFTEMLAARYVEDITAEVVPAADSERAALVLRFATPKPPDAETIIELSLSFSSDERPPYAPPGQVFRLLANAVFSRDLGWLSAVPQDEERALLEELAALEE